MKKYRWFEIAESKLGEHEIPGPATNEFIGDCLESIGLPRDDSIAWCSAFANMIMELAGYQGTGSGMARSWLNWGREPADEEFGKGVIVILYRGDPNGPSGHVGFLADWTDDRVKLLGGNQGDAVSYAWFSQDRVIGWRIPA